MSELKKMQRFKGLPDDLGSLKNMQSQAINGKKNQGYIRNIQAGITKYSLTLSGSARQLLGILFAPPEEATPNNIQVTLTINNDIIFRDSIYTLLSIQGRIINEFYFYPRALSGQDSIEITFESNAAGKVFWNFYYI